MMGDLLVPMIFLNPWTEQVTSFFGGEVSLFDDQPRVRGEGNSHGHSARSLTRTHVRNAMKDFGGETESWLGLSSGILLEIIWKSSLRVAAK